MDAAQPQEVADRHALYDLVVGYCRATDRRDKALMRTLYHPDAIDDHGALFYGTRDSFIDFLPGPVTAFATTTHHITNTLFRIDGDYAEGESYLIACHITRETPPRNLTVSGRYLDKFERRSGVWRFIHRVCMVDWANMPARRDCFPAATSAGPCEPARGGGPQRSIVSVAAVTGGVAGTRRASRLTQWRWLYTTSLIVHLAQHPAAARWSLGQEGRSANA